MASYTKIILNSHAKWFITDVWEKIKVVLLAENTAFFPRLCLRGDEELSQKTRVQSNQQSSFNERKQKAPATQDGLHRRMS